MLSTRRKILIRNIQSEIENLEYELIEQLNNETMLNPKAKELKNIAASISNLKMLTQN